MFQDLKNQIALLGLQYVGKLIPLHIEHFVFELFGEFPAFVNTQKPALIFGAAVGVAFGNSAKIFSVLHALQRCLRFFLQRRQLIGALALRAHFNLAQGHFLRAHKLGLVRFVILLDFIFADTDVRPDFLADHSLRQNAVADVVLEVFPVHPFGSDRLLQGFHAVQLVLDANLVELLDHVGLDVEAHVLAALDKQRLVNQLAQRIFLAVRNVGLQLFGSAAALAFLLGVIYSSLSRLLVFGKCDDFIVHSRDDLFDGLAGGVRVNGLRCGQSLQFRRCRRRWLRLRCSRRGRLGTGFRLCLSCWGRRSLGTRFLLVFCQQRERRTEGYE